MHRRVKAAQRQMANTSRVRQLSFDGLLALHFQNLFAGMDGIENRLPVGYGVCTASVPLTLGRCQ